jgi:ATP-binding cassette, subfamily B, multidrug efflux pump
LPYLKPHRGSILIVFGMAVLSTVFSVAGPKILGKSITILFDGDDAEGQGHPRGCDRLREGRRHPAGPCWACTWSAGFSYATQLVMAGVSQKTVYSFRKAIDQKLARLPLSYFDGRTHGEILSRVTNDVDVIANTLQQSLVQMITAVVTLIGSVAMMFTISWQLSLVAIGPCPSTCSLPPSSPSARRATTRAQQKLLGELNGHVEEMYSGHPVVKAFGYEKQSVQRFDEVNGKLYHVAWKAQFVSGIIMPVMNFINNSVMY